jgi:glycine oxidase
VLIVVGAGIIGLSCAWRLAQRGLAVTVFDAREAAREASWAGAGMLAPGGEITAVSPLATAALSSLAEYPEFVRELEEESGVSIDFRHSGAMEVAFDDSEAEALEQKGALQAEIGIRSERCRHDGRDARFYPDDSLVDPRDVTKALLTACHVRGVEIREDEPVLDVARSGKSVRTAAGEYSGDGVVLAAGAWSSSLMEGLPRTMPVRGHLISWPLSPGLVGPILRHGHTYLLQRKTGILIAGATTEQVGFDRKIDASAVEDLLSRAGELFAPLKGLEPSEQWNGFRPGIEAEAPAVGRIEGTSVWTAFGHYRNGILLAPETARRIADAISPA